MADHKEDFGQTLWVVNTIFIVLATFAVLGRFAARRLRKLPLGVDDWIICVALFWDWLLYGISYADTNTYLLPGRINGLCKHRAKLPPQEVVVFEQLLYFFNIFYVLGPPSVKLSLLFLYQRIFKRPYFLRMVYGMIALISTWAIIMLFLAIFNCKPISAFWTHEGTCLNFKQFAIGYAIVNIITDFTIWLMPIPCVWQLQLPKLQKVAVSLIFALGLFDCAVAMARLLISMLVLGKYDSTWLYAKGYMWSIIEVSTGIICTCLPTMWVLLKATFGGKFARIFGMSSEKTGRQRPSNTPWSKAKEGNETGAVIGVKASSSRHCADMFSDLRDPEWDASSRRILVIEEVSVELQPVKQTLSVNAI
ncbi:uncharacterized protein N7498_002101 [Penicillium cinerascens]|uniref:Rhodopsin domain-containing protein n=1 Tax=Penicillium cinerascens TaxID=70096 RepID=A0A9W9NB75_9EURO|nr:uncharacterized protein N7498_002101 [Penicillium cinerascens]KAJ5215694.1 hypothetical protein N7498_002101 [Penicillium cinerascens]